MNTYQSEVEDMDEDSPAEVPDAPEEPEVPDAEEEAPTEELPEEAPVGAEDPAAVADEEPENPAVEAPAPRPSPVGHKRYRIPTPQDLDNEDALFAQDLQRGHIKPETLQSLYGKKDTLGKIGTLFGLLVSGMGSGLSGQPNAVLEMMNNQIKNDFEAQKLSNENAQNWLRLSQAHHMQKAQIGQMATQNKLTEAEIGKIPAEIEQTKAHTGVFKAQADMEATNAAIAKAKLGALRYLQDQVDKMPDGPSKENAAQTLSNVVTPAIQQDLAKNNAQTAAKVTAAAALSGTLPEQPKPGVDYKKLNLLKAAGDQAAQLGITAAPGKAMDAHQASAAMQEAGLVDQNRAIYDAWKDSFEHLDQRALGGKVNKADRDAAVELLSAQISKTTGASNEVAKKQADSLFPGALDWGGARAQKAKKGVEHFQIQESETPTLNNFALKAPFPAPPRIKGHKPVTKTASKSSGPKEGQTGKANGKPVVFRNGKWTAADQSKVAKSK